MDNKLESLLNNLLKDGWEPFNRNKTLHITCYDKCKGMNYKWIHLDGGFMNEESRTLRELVSIDSGLWQYVCRNGMIKQIQFEDELGNVHYHKWSSSKGNYKPACNYGYRLIESSLKDESELEQFLLDNIIVEG